jgi:hypothetical protein
MSQPHVAKSIAKREMSYSAISAGELKKGDRPRAVSQVLLAILSLRRSVKLDRKIEKISLTKSELFFTFVRNQNRCSLGEGLAFIRTPLFILVALH